MPWLWCRVRARASSTSPSAGASPTGSTPAATIFHVDPVAVGDGRALGGAIAHGRSPGSPPSSSPVGVVKAAPPKPTNTTYAQVKETTNAAQTQITEEYRATWDEPAGSATKFTIYGVTECLRESAENDEHPVRRRGHAHPGVEAQGPRDGHG